MVSTLLPGQRLEIDAGTYVINDLFSIDRQGTAAAPIWIAARPGAVVTITRGDARQNVVNLGVFSPARFVVLEGLDIRGGSTGIKLFDCSDVQVHDCHVYDTANAGITANSHNNDRLTFTHNEIHDAGGTAEGFYLGADFGVEHAPPYAAAARHTDLAGLPPAWVTVGDLDLFLDEDIAYVRRLQEAGVPADLHRIPGGFHGVFAVGREQPAIRTLWNELEAFLQTWL